MLYCVECGCCSGELGKGWVAFRCDDPEDGEGPEIAIWCPVCAAEEFGYRPDIAATYVRGWEPLPMKRSKALSGRRAQQSTRAGRGSRARGRRTVGTPPAPTIVPL